MYKMSILFLVFFFKQKTAYEMLRSLVGSEMCIRDRLRLAEFDDLFTRHVRFVDRDGDRVRLHLRGEAGPVSYTHLTLPTIYSV